MLRTGLDMCLFIMLPLMRAGGGGGGGEETVPEPGETCNN